MSSAHDRWVAQNRERLVDRLGEERVEEWESVIDDHRLPDGHLPDYQILLLMDAAFHQGAFREQVKTRELNRSRGRMPQRQPLIAHVIGQWYRSWFWHPDAPRQNKKGKRRSAKRERQRIKEEIRGTDD